MKVWRIKFAVTFIWGEVYPVLTPAATPIYWKRVLVVYLFSPCKHRAYLKWFTNFRCILYMVITSNYAI